MSEQKKMQQEKGGKKVRERDSPQKKLEKKNVE
jgi:hypothetical protein